MIVVKSLFSSSFQTWRQLWRVLEMSDIILLIVDIRHPVGEPIISEVVIMDRATRGSHCQESTKAQNNIFTSFIVHIYHLLLLFY